MVWKRKPDSAARARHWLRSSIRTRFIRSTAVAAAAAAGVAKAATTGGDGAVRGGVHRGEARLAGADAAGGVEAAAAARGRARPALGLVLVGRAGRRGLRQAGAA